MLINCMTGSGAREFTARPALQSSVTNKRGRELTKLNCGATTESSIALSKRTNRAAQREKAVNL